MRMASSIFGSMGRTASYLEGSRRQDGSVPSGKEVRRGGAGNDGGSLPRAVRSLSLSASQAATIKPGSAGRQAREQQPQRPGRGHSARPLALPASLHPEFSARFSRWICLGCMKGRYKHMPEPLPGEDSDSAGEWRLCSIGAGTVS